MTIGRDITTRVLEQALQAATLRQNVLANNIANIGTPGFKRARVEFERHLAQALQKKADPTSVRPMVVVEQDRSAFPDGNNVDVEAEMVRLAENQIWYSALTRTLSDHFARLRTVIYDGRR
ncbi:MAG TPA: flagellar basal body protein [Symbiobacteriaceae bacterium]